MAFRKSMKFFYNVRAEMPERAHYQTDSLVKEIHQYCYILARNPVPPGLKSYCTRATTVSIACVRKVPMMEICIGATWSLMHFHQTLLLRFSIVLRCLVWDSSATVQT